MIMIKTTYIDIYLFILSILLFYIYILKVLILLNFHYRFKKIKILLHFSKYSNFKIPVTKYSDINIYFLLLFLICIEIVILKLFREK